MKSAAHRPSSLHLSILGLASTLLWATACGKLSVDKPKPQVQPDLEMPVPDSLEQPLGLTAQKTKLRFDGTILLFNPTVQPEKIKAISDGSTTRRKREAESVKNVSALVGEVKKSESRTESLRGQLAALTLGENDARAKRWLEDSTFVYDELDQLRIRGALSDSQHAHALGVFEKYCEAQVWDFVLASRLFRNNEFESLPNPLIFCSKTYVEKGILYEPKAVFDPTANDAMTPRGRCAESVQAGGMSDYFACFVHEGLGQTSFFKNLYSPTIQQRILDLADGKVAGLSYNEAYLSEYGEALGASPKADALKRVFSTALGEEFLTGGIKSRKIFQKDDSNFCCAFKDKLGSGYDDAASAEEADLPDGLDGYKPFALIHEVYKNGEDASGQVNPETAMFPMLRDSRNSLDENAEAAMEKIISFIEKIAHRPQGLSTADVVVTFDRSRLGQLKAGEAGYLRDEAFFLEALGRKQAAAAFLPAFFDESFQDPKQIAKREKIEGELKQAEEAGTKGRSAIQTEQADVFDFIATIVELPKEEGVSAAFYSVAGMEILQDGKNWEVRLRLHPDAPILRACLEPQSGKTLACSSKLASDQELSKGPFAVSYDRTTGKLDFQIPLGKAHEAYGFENAPLEDGSRYFNYLADQDLEGSTLEMEFFVSEMATLTVLSGSVYVRRDDFRLYDGGIAMSDYGSRLGQLDAELAR